MTLNICNHIKRIQKKYANMRIGPAWSVMNQLSTIWDSGLSRFGIVFFRAAGGSLLIYNANYWALTKELERNFKEMYPEFLRRVQIIYRGG